MSEKYIILSIIIPMYNTEKFIVRCLESCYKQNLSEDSFEVIVIDDGSTDSSYSLVECFKKDHKNLSLYHQKNQGQGAARNFGIEKARGKYILFLDSDDCLINNRINSVLRKALENKVEIAKFLIISERSNGELKHDVFNSNLLTRIITGEDALFLNNNIGSVCNGIYLRNFIISNNFRFLTDIKHEDVAFEYTIYPYVKRIIYCNAECYYYTYNSNSTDRTRSLLSKKLLVFSNLRIAHLLKQQSCNIKFSSKLRNYFLKTSNSILVSTFFEAIQNHYPIKSFVLDTKKLKLIPAKGCSRSWKTTLMLPLINIFFACHKYIR